MACKYAINCSTTMSECSKGLFGGRPSHGTCLKCPHNTDPDWHAQKVKEMLASRPVSVQIAPQSPVQPVPRDKWPIGVKLIAEARKPGDTGVGDIVARKLGKTGEAFKAFMKSIGIDCGCQQRQEWLNQRYPLK